MAAAIYVTLSLESLGQIPEHHQDESRKGRRAHSYFDDSLCDEPLEKQIKHFGKKATLHMIESELSSWLSDLGVIPQIHSITVDQ